MIHYCTYVSSADYMLIDNSICFCSIFGMYDFGVRSYFLRDPEAFKRITIKDFGHFQDHRVVFSMDEMLRNILTQMEGEKWHRMRATLSPTFTGSKMRLMFDLITECADRIVVHLSEKVASGERINVEMKDFFTRYTNDVIATCAFGIEVNSFADPDNEFFASAKRVTKPSLLLTLSKFIFAKCLPRVARALDIKVLDTDPFKKIILEAMEIRQKNKITRPDMINTLMQLQQEQQTNEESEVEKKSNENADVVRHKWDDNELLAQCFIFFSAGLEPPSIILTFAAYELVCNPDIQQKLYEEIAEVDNDLDGKRISYDAIQKMKYLDQVINETLRKWPSVVATDRVCVKDYDYDDGRLNFKMEKGSVVTFSIFEMHHNPSHYPNPDKFDPERFSDENKHNIIPGTLAPFGLGPRNCIGVELYIFAVSYITNISLRSQVLVSL